MTEYVTDLYFEKKFIYRLKARETIPESINKLISEGIISKEGVVRSEQYDEHDKNPYITTYLWLIESKLHITTYFPWSY